MIFTIESNEPLAPSVYRMALAGDTSKIRAPGQFVNIAIDGLYLRRPISVCDWDERTLVVIYKVIGRGTKALAQMRPGATLDLLTGLGNGYDLSVDMNAPLLIGGGVGVPPLYALAKRLKNPSVILGFNTKSEVFYEAEFRALSPNVTVCTADGSYGVKGFVTEPMGQIEYDYVFTCGPEPMLRAVYNKATSPGQFSFERRMGCGFGACRGCSCETNFGPKRVCMEGPVLTKEEILWQT